MRERDPSNITTLDDFAKTEPSLDYLQALARHLALKYAVDRTEFFKTRTAEFTERDMQFENIKLKKEHYDLYE